MKRMIAGSWCVLFLVLGVYATCVHDAQTEMIGAAVIIFWVGFIVSIFNLIRVYRDE